MKKIIVSSMMLLMVSNINAQFERIGETNIERMNLKGPVASVLQSSCEVNEAFGEWKIGTKTPVNYYIFNSRGNLLLEANAKTQDRRIYVYEYHYNPLGKLDTIFYDGETLKNNSFDVLSEIYYRQFIKNRSDFHEVYDYNDNGNLLSITSYQKTKDDPNHITSKTIRKYTDDGYEVIYYSWDGTRRDDIQKIVSQNGNLIQTKSDNYEEIKYNEKGLVESFSSSAGHIKSLSSVKYYAYNDNGDVIAQAYTTEDLDLFKKNYPQSKNNLQGADVVFYEYEYDSQGNWTTRKKYGFRRDEIIITEWVIREITYSKDGVDGESIMSDIKKKAELSLEAEIAAKAEEEARMEWNRRPRYATLPSISTITQWLEPVIKYPNASSPLGSILTYYESYLQFDVYGYMDTECNIFYSKNEPLLEEHIKASLFNNKSYLIASKKDSDNIKAQDEINQMKTAIYAAIIKNLKGERPGQYGRYWHLSICLQKGRVKVDIEVDNSKMPEDW